MNGKGQQCHPAGLQAKRSEALQYLTGWPAAHSTILYHNHSSTHERKILDLFFA
jgi:hypothetical protein